MIYRSLGKTGIRVSAIAFGAGPVPALVTDQANEAQLNTVRRAIAVGINWFDTAATYGDGASERSLGAAIRNLHYVDVASPVASDEKSLILRQRQRTHDIFSALNDVSAPGIGKP